jgi:hypothetical protein
MNSSEILNNKLKNGELSKIKKNLSSSKEQLSKENAKNNIIKKKVNNIKLINKHPLSSEKPYILKIKKFIDNERLLGDKSLLEYTQDISPLSGSELKYEPEKWNSNTGIKESHNCYSYALGKIVKGLKSKAQPGYASGFNHIEDNEYDCASFRDRLKRDSPGSYLEKFDNACEPGFYKIFLALDLGNDYHWWQMNDNAYWSHKPGSTEVVNVDANGDKIKNPLKANRNYGSLNYHQPCFFACIYSDLSRSLDEIYGE